MPLSPATSRASAAITQLFKSTLAAPAATIDTGAIIPSNLTALEILIYGRTDEAVVHSGVFVRFNGDSAAHYDKEDGRADNVTASALNQLGAAGAVASVAGASQGASIFGSTRIIIPAYGTTAGFKTLEMICVEPSTVAANARVGAVGWLWESTAAINQVTITATTGGANLIAGTVLAVYGIS